MAKSTSKATSKRTTIAPNGDKRYIRRDEQGRIKESDDQGKSLSQDRKRQAKTKAEPGQGDKGDRAPKKAAAKKRSAASKSR